MRPLFPQLAGAFRLGWRWPEALRALRHRNFRLFFFGQLVSLSGNWMQTTAQQWLVYRITGSQLSLGMVTFAAFVPVLLLSLFMGVVVDRAPRRQILLLTQGWFMLLAVVLAVLAAFDAVQYWHILTLAVLMGIANALDMPARQAFFADMVDRKDLLNAIALNSSAFNGARIIGPAVAGLVVAALGEAPAFAVNALSYLAVIAALVAMRLPPLAADPNRGSGLSALAEGLRHVARDRRVLGLVVMIALFSLFGFPYLVLLPAVARDVLGTGAEGYGALMASMGVGALVGGLGLAALGDRVHKGRLLLASRAVFALSIGVFGFTRSVAPAMLALAVAGYAFITQLATTNTLIQLLVPDALRGRVLSAYTWSLGGFWPLGALLFGALGDALGAPGAVLLAAGSAVLLTVGAWFALPETRRLA